MSDDKARAVKVWIVEDDALAHGNNLVAVAWKEEQLTGTRMNCSYTDREAIAVDPQWLQHQQAKLDDQQAEIERLKAEERDATLNLHKYIKTIEDENDSLQARVEELAELPEKCVWKHSDYYGSYLTECGMTWCFVEGSIEENSTHYCPKCGGKIEQALQGEGE